MAQLIKYQIKSILSHSDAAGIVINIGELQFEPQFLITAPMLKNRLPRDYKPAEIYRLELSNDEMAYISQQLPFGYSLVLQPKKNIPKHIIQAARRRNASLQSEDSGGHSRFEREASVKGAGQGASKSIAVQKPTSKPVVNPNNKWIEQLSNDGLKKAAKILLLLRAHKSSWPFLSPVDADALQIPDYYEIIKDPMDLLTIENKLKGQKYTDFSQFNADVMKIVENSFKFNEANEDYLKITSEFESYYTKQVSQNIVVDNKNNSKNAKKKKKSSVSNRQFSDSVPVTLTEKKQLAQQIRRLGKQHIKNIRLIVFEGQQDQADTFDLEKLSQKKLRELQKYIRSKIIAMEERNRSTQQQKVQINNLSMCESDESSFLTDSSEE